MKKFLWLITLVMVLISLFLSLSTADVTSIMSYQGMLTDDTGTALDGDYKLIFAISGILVYPSLLIRVQRERGFSFFRQLFRFPERTETEFSLSISKSPIQPENTE